jgi:hypothetical protein
MSADMLVGQGFLQERSSVYQAAFVSTVPYLCECYNYSLWIDQTQILYLGHNII